MTPKEAVASVKKVHPNHVPTQVLDYDNDYYIVEALPKGVDKSSDDPYYAVEKKTGKVYFYHPGGDFIKFFDALDNRAIKIGDVK